MSALPDCHLAGDDVFVSADDEFVDFNPALHFERWLDDVQTTLGLMASRLPDPAIDTENEIFLDSQIRSHCEVNFEGVLHFDGYSIGDVRSPGGTLVLTKRGRIEADIEVATAIIDGVVTGNITANERVVLESDARVRGQIFTPALSIRLGAVLDGDCVFVTPNSAAIELPQFATEPIVLSLEEPRVSPHFSSPIIQETDEELEEFLLTA
ncbi:MAG TPA: polymer-forming cytoskeletal protein [Pyrinomonadaceae bacterium]|nr:polymer-forming cytoskeletal protein [Pyrinomonadaceae bacterium]